MKKANPYKSVGNYTIPFDLEGNQLHYPTNYTVESAAVTNKWRAEQNYFPIPDQWIMVWVPNRPFGGSYQFVDISRGRSAAYFNLKNVNTGKDATMFMKDVLGAIPFFIRGYLNGTFAYCKRGANFGIRFLHEGEPDHDAVLEHFGP